MSEHEYTIEVIEYSDGTLVADSQDIRERVLESDSMSEFLEGMVCDVPRLLKANCALTDEDVENIVIRVELRDASAEEELEEAEAILLVPRPRIAFKDNRQVALAA